MPTRDEKLTNMMRKHRTLLNEKKPLQLAADTANKALQAKNRQIKRVGQAIYDLKHSGNTPVVTDHAIVRYLERIEGVDIDDLKVKVANHAQAQKIDNVVVTVMEQYDDDGLPPLTDQNKP